MVYADLNNDGTINPATEILEENNYYLFGLQHQGYNDIASSCRNEEAEAYKFLNKEYEDSFALNVTETDYRHYDSALGRFNVLDPMAELAPDFTPYRYGFNNPVIWSDASGLFETYSQAMSFLRDNGLDGRVSWFDKNDPSKGFIATVVGGEFDGTTFYDFGELLSEVQVSTGGGGNNNGGGNSNIKNFQGVKYNNEAFTYAMGSSVILLGDDVTGIGVADDVLIPVIWEGAAGAWLYDNNALLQKQLTEIGRIIDKQLKPSGFTYELRVNRSGNYTDVRGNQIFLNAGDIWKYGETSKGNSRYSRSTLDNMVPGGVTLHAIFLGNQTEIKVQEKIMIYWYAIQNGNLPPGNKIFR